MTFLQLLIPFCQGQDQVVAYLLLLVLLEDQGLAYENQNLSIPNIKI